MGFNSRTFRKEIPDELAVRLFNLVGVTNLEDTKYWQKSVLSPATCNKFNNMLPELEAYYYPHKLFLIKREMSINRYVQILRQVAKAKGKYLQSKEYVIAVDNKKKKCLMYRFKPEELKKEVPVGGFIISFQ